MTRTIRLLLILAALPAVAAAQSAQRLSIQGSGAMVFPTAEESGFENDTRLGWEAQLRYTFSRFSLGAGYQRATVYKFATGDFSGAVSTLFVEPRYVVTAATRTALYLAGRVGVGRLECNPTQDCADQSWEAAYGGGGGVLFLLGSRVSLDLGGQYFATSYTLASGEKATPGYVMARLGLSIGL
jgi:opacity protein-like surface antigen